MTCISSRVCALCSALMIICSVPVQAQTPAVLPDSVRASVASAVQQGGRVGVVIGYSQEGRHEFFAEGVLIAGGEAPINADSVFEVGSVTKLFTAETLAALALNSAVSLETPLSQIWPEALPHARITLGDLATHRAGLPRAIPAMALQHNDEAALLASVRGHHAPAPDAAYSNLGMAVLARALARRTGRSVSDTLFNQLTGPGGLTQTGYDIIDPHRLAHPHLERMDTYGARTATADIARGAGGLYTTPRDLLRFVDQHVNPPTDVIARQVAVTLEGYDGRPLGWQVHDDGARRIYHHGGDANGYQVFVGFRRDTATSVVVMANSSTEDALQQIGLHLLDGSVPLPQFTRSGGQSSQNDLSGYVGDYTIEGDDSGNVITLSATADGLAYAEFGPDGALVRRAPLRMRDPGVFQIRGTPIVLVFVDGPTGEARLVVGDTQMRMLRQN